LKELLKKKSEADENTSDELSTPDSALNGTGDKPGENRQAPENSSTNNQSMTFMCDQCDFQSRKEHILKEHIQVDHSPTQKKTIYIFDICEFICESQAIFKKHRKDTHQEKKYNCDHCGTKLNSLQALNNHIQMFHKKKPEYTCEHCDSRFSSVENVKKHMSYRQKNISKACQYRKYEYK
jgi:hypothetical protein